MNAIKSENKVNIQYNINIHGVTKELLTKYTPENRFISCNYEQTSERF